MSDDIFLLYLSHKTDLHHNDYYNILGIMKLRAILILCLALVVGAPNTSAQSFMGKLKKATEKIGKQIKEEVTNTITPKKSTKSTSTKKRLNSNKSTKSHTKATDLPETHTALFAPIGEVKATYGTKKSTKPVKPPYDESKQPDWNDSRTPLDELDNASLLEEYKVLQECLDTKFISGSGPAAHRYWNVLNEIKNRVNALNDMVEMYTEAKYEYGQRDKGEEGAEEWIEHYHNQLVKVLKSQAYKSVIATSIAPFFIDDLDINQSTKEYFEAQGGYENAHKAKLTIWNP